jgi:hypothetical protein
MSPNDVPGEPVTGPQESHSSEIAIELSESLRRKAEEMAISDGISLEDFILYAVAEKVARSEAPDQD